MGLILELNIDLILWLIKAFFPYHNSLARGCKADKVLICQLFCPSGHWIGHDDEHLFAVWACDIIQDIVIFHPGILFGALPTTYRAIQFWSAAVLGVFLFFCGVFHHVFQWIPLNIFFHNIHLTFQSAAFPKKKKRLRELIQQIAEWNLPTATLWLRSVESFHLASHRFPRSPTSKEEKWSVRIGPRTGF